jgi:hypothetical protein
MGVHPVTIEVNPFLADLIESKLICYDTDSLARDLGHVIGVASSISVNPDEDLAQLPPTFVEPGRNGRWIFDRVVATRIAALLKAFDSIENENHRRLFRVLLGGVLIDASNVIINGKGRRYRQRASRHNGRSVSLDDHFRKAAQRAIREIHRFARRACTSYELRRDDCRLAIREMDSFELAVFSPPYPTSFDYTDVYNIELWTLGYLTDSDANRRLRTSTLCSHVQLGREFPQAPTGSEALDCTLRLLGERSVDLWDRRIPAMVGGYFSDLLLVLDQLSGHITRAGSVWMVIGDSRYADVKIEAGKIIAELSDQVGWKVDSLESCRSMRASPQQGGRLELEETLVVLMHR